MHASSSSSQLFMPLLADGLHNSCYALWSWATPIHWLPPTSSMLSLHLLLGLPLARLPSLGVHSDIILGHLVLLVLTICSAHCPLMHCTLPIISTTFVFDLITSFRILSLFVMFSNGLSMLRWATAIFFSWSFVRVHVSTPYVITGSMTVSMIIFLFRQIGILLSFKKWLYSPNLLHPDVILRSVSLSISLGDTKFIVRSMDSPLLVFLFWN